MKIEINIDSYWTDYIMKHNLAEKIMPYIGLGEVLQWMAEHPEILKKERSTLYTGDKEIGIVLEMIHKDDSYCVTVYDIV